MNATYTGCYICEPTGSRIIKKDENSRKWKRKNERKINKIKEKKKMTKKTVGNSVWKDISYLTDIKEIFFRNSGN